MAERRDVLERLAEEHGPASVRHIFYAAVVAQLSGITKDQAGYNKVQTQVLNLRRSGRIPYDQITDSTRWMRKSPSFDSWQEAVERTAAMYRRNLWSSSLDRVEVWAESDSIAGVIHQVTNRWDVPLMVCRGQASETFAHSAAEAWAQSPKRPVVLYVGDHDPHGLDIEESLQEKLRRFHYAPEHIEWTRIGITAEQVVSMDLPTTKPKLTNRKKPYPFDWAAEAEALPAVLLRELLDSAISRYVDHDQLEVLRAAEAAERQSLLALARREVPR